MWATTTATALAQTRTDTHRHSRGLISDAWETGLPIVRVDQPMKLWSRAEMQQQSDLEHRTAEIVQGLLSIGGNEHLSGLRFNDHASLYQEVSTEMADANTIVPNVDCRFTFEHDAGL